MELPITQGPVLADVDGGVLTLTLNRPESLNAVTAESLSRLEELVLAASTLPAVRVVVLRGAGKGFSSGADLGGGDGQEASSATIDAGNGVVTAIRRCALPVVAVVHGPCAGIGVSIALSADIVVAGEKAFFLLAFANIGLMPDGGATALVAAAVGRPRAMQMALLGQRVPAQQAEQWGLISQVVADDELQEQAAHVIATLAAGPSRAYAATKAAVNDATLDQLDPAFQRERYAQGKLLGSDDFAEGSAAFLQRRPAQFTGN